MTHDEFQTSIDQLAIPVLCFCSNHIYSRAETYQPNLMYIKTVTKKSFGKRLTPFQEIHYCFKFENILSFFQPVHPFASFCQKPAHSPTKTQYLIPSYLYIYIIIYQYHACLYTHDNLMKPLPKLSHHTSKKQILYAHIPLDHVTTYSYPIIPSYTHISHYTIQHHSIIIPLYHQDCPLGICQHML